MVSTNLYKLKQKILCRSIKQMTVICFFLFANSANAENRIWNLENLNGIESYHDGPNCFNAALAAKGIVKRLVYIDSVEMLFYLENYCRPISKPVFGDILTVKRENTLEHAAISLNSGRIFEKHSTSGTFGLYSSSDTFYRKILLSDSYYFTQEQDVRKTIGYSCKNANVIISDIQSLCSENNFLLLIENIRSQFEKLALNRTKTLIIPSSLLVDINKFTNFLSNMNPLNSCTPYAFSIGVSTFGSLYHLNNEQLDNSELLKQKQLLMMSLKNLKHKIKSQNPKQKTLDLISEFTWISN